MDKTTRATDYSASVHYWGVTLHLILQFCEQQSYHGQEVISIILFVGSTDKTNRKVFSMLGYNTKLES